ncbi:glycerol-3-phosphate cytidylyltransferase [Candidatus Caldarchaeum subterraneum]|uniref:Glycerol-3-phosphate cytidylyltransferase n=1 Tax=Caldiarchaeum subterraneum TaxID=311458 RepID=E6N8M8_CALS0|nr:glycerol-3-phosphate cytidylyltransferase [Candidatus Caldarchaeum subterraneum]BAJ49697.1 glycerol-3-phosphate cytidylyltransferase [Candidatus Caldarchaeum subterraneum]BAJ51352.1 glycerol-3-phosphate cytidylyltransferase [Candidatus Caldarchaeum subterraneum]
MKSRTVLTTGAFDILHLGHMLMLKDAKKLAGPRGKLVVVVASDKTVRRNKGRAPIFGARERKKMLQFLKPVDEVLIGYDPVSFEKILRKVRPDIVAFGYDQRKIRDQFLRFCRERKVKVRVVTLRKHNVNPVSSSDVVKRVLSLGKRVRRL